MSTLAQSTELPMFHVNNLILSQKVCQFMTVLILSKYIVYYDLALRQCIINLWNKHTFLFNTRHYFVLSPQCRICISHGYIWLKMPLLILCLCTFLLFCWDHYISLFQMNVSYNTLFLIKRLYLIRRATFFCFLIWFKEKRTSLNIKSCISVIRYSALLKWGGLWPTLYLLILADQGIGYTHHPTTPYPCAFTTQYHQSN